MGTVGRSGGYGMDIGAIAKGFLAGAAIAAPVGPVGLLCIHRGISSGQAAAFLSGLGGGTVTALLLASRVFLGSASWWLLLSLGVGWVSSRGGVPSLRIANRVTGAALLGFGLYLLFRKISSP